MRNTYGSVINHEERQCSSLESGQIKKNLPKVEIFYTKFAVLDFDALVVLWHDSGSKIHISIILDLSHRHRSFPLAKVQLLLLLAPELWRIPQINLGQRRCLVTQSEARVGCVSNKVNHLHVVQDDRG